MNLVFRDEEGNLFSRSISDMVLDMEIVKKRSGYIVQVNKGYYDEEIFDHLIDAERRLLYLSDMKNKLEN